MTIKEYECPDCDGKGEVMEAVLYPTGHHERWVECPFCEGEGCFNEADWLVLKLEGKV